MESELFTNKIGINASEEVISDVLMNLKNILKWDKEISDVCEMDENQFMIVRNQSALNPEEVITVTKVDNCIIYISTKGKLEYSVLWTMHTMNSGATELMQTLRLKEKNLWVPIAQFIKPVLRTAFFENLRVLKQFCEMDKVGQ